MTDADLIDRLVDIVGSRYVLTGEAAEPWARDWTGAYVSTPLAIVRPASSGEVSDIVRLAARLRRPIVPASGRTGLSGGGLADGAIVVSVDRLDRIRAIKPEAGIAIVEAGVVLQTLQERVALHGGRLRVGPENGSGFVVEAELPFDGSPARVAESVS